MGLYPARPDILIAFPYFRLDKGCVDCAVVKRGRRLTAVLCIKCTTAGAGQRRCTYHLECRSMSMGAYSCAQQAVFECRRCVWLRRSRVGETTIHIKQHQPCEKCCQHVCETAYTFTCTTCEDKAHALVAGKCCRCSATWNAVIVHLPDVLTRIVLELCEITQG